MTKATLLGTTTTATTPHAATSATRPSPYSSRHGFRRIPRRCSSALLHASLQRFRGEDYEDDGYEDGYEYDEQYYDCYEDTVDWEENDTHVGMILSWNEERNYGVISVMDDYTIKPFNDSSSQLFCHGSNFVDGDDCALTIGDDVQFTVVWDYARDRWHAMAVAALTTDADATCIEKMGLSGAALSIWYDGIEFFRA